ncbi:hypothetical protein GCM10023085_51630 [Actinomadura viridis]|uniref:DUF3566 domain-containing protein n=1 Tax=Actinomadura viridis TaxID=58110 RepID=A0A931DLM5_9ACTN|nr:DUF3566 domain-containing protein [Actinomadura viridis]MBG6092260.1 hypothetical protein [Actinomadura viridis]
MSTQPGKDKGGAGKGSGEGDSPAGGKPRKKTVAASASKPGRDEATVEITPAEETKVDLPRVEPEAERPEIAPVKDTGDASDWTKPAEPATSVSGTRAESSGPTFSAAEPPSGGTSGPAAPTAPPAGSQAPGSAPRAASGPGSRFGAAFAGSVLKNRPGKASSAQAAGSAKSARKAQLQLARLEPWSVMKFSFVMSLVCFVVLLVAVIVLYAILSGLGVFSAITDTVSELTRRQGETSGGLDAGSWFSFARVFGYTVLVGALNVLLITALSTVGSVIYNLAADLVGGVEVTLKEAE